MLNQSIHRMLPVDTIRTFWGTSQVWGINCKVVQKAIIWTINSTPSSVDRDQSQYFQLRIRYRIEQTPNATFTLQAVYLVVKSFTPRMPHIFGDLVYR